jgi:hypothetical protein
LDIVRRTPPGGTTGRIAQGFRAENSGRITKIKPRLTISFGVDSLGKRFFFEIQDNAGGTPSGSFIPGGVSEFKAVDAILVGSSSPGDEREVLFPNKPFVAAGSDYFLVLKWEEAELGTWPVNRPFLKWQGVIAGAGGDFYPPGRLAQLGGSTSTGNLADLSWILQPPEWDNWFQVFVEIQGFNDTDFFTWKFGTGASPFGKAMRLRLDTGLWEDV